MWQLAVDLGADRTKAALAGPGVPPRVVELDGAASMPSAVYAHEDGSLLTGSEARHWGQHEPDRYEAHPVLRAPESTLVLGGRPVRVVDALAAVLTTVGEAVHQLVDQHPGQVLLTVPAYWSAAQTQALHSAVAATPWARADVRVVPSVLAAAAHCHRAGVVPTDQPFVVHDVGAGGLSTAVVVVGAGGPRLLAAAGAGGVGGVGADALLVQHVGAAVSGEHPAAWQSLVQPRDLPSRRSALALRQRVRLAREQLSAESVTAVALPPPFASLPLGREELDHLLAPQLSRGLDLLGGALQQAGVAPTDLAGVVLLGGFARTPGVADSLATRFSVLGHGDTSATVLGASVVEPPVAAPAVAAPPRGWAGPTATAAPAHQPVPTSGSSRTALAAIAAAAALVVVLVVAVVVVVLNQPASAPATAQPASSAPAPTTSSTPPTTSTAPTTTSTPPTTTSTAAAAPPPLVAGWQTVASSDRGAAYDVPPGWKVASEGTIGGFETKSGDRVVGKGYTSFASDFCDQFTSKANSALTGSDQADPAAAALQVATRWATVAFTDDAGVVPPLAPGAPRTVVSPAGTGSLVEVTAPLAKKQECSAPAGAMYAYALPGSTPGRAFVLVVHAARGVPDEVSAAVVEQIATTVRPLG
ncbi:Hsp70 family protein [Rhodococcus sp. X156]|uniref:Hsp70 family protein n=1 Tax=Rhodococcus sp. X156 TaxID=2499145 RepID=UPI0013E3304E|nr:Hsp70 family protein [Rhodococcus sp. X156]